ncbi:MAG: DMT family transporter [Actinomycetota bacterium]
MTRRSLPTFSSTGGTVAIAFVGVAYAFGTFFARRLTDAGLSPTTVAFARFALVAVVLAPCLRRAARHRRALVWGLTSGAVMALGWIAYVDGIGSGDVALVGVAYMTYPLFTLVMLAVVFGRRPTARQIGGGLLVLGAAFVALSAESSGGGVPLITFAAPATFGFSLAVLTERLEVLAPSERLASAAVGAALTLLPFVGRLPADGVVPSSVSQWAWVVGLGVGAALVPMLIYAAAAPVLGAARSAVAGATELPMVFLIGGVVFGEVLTGRHLAAAGLVMVAIVVSSSGRTPHVLPDGDEPEDALESWPVDAGRFVEEIPVQGLRKRTYVR